MRPLFGCVLIACLAAALPAIAQSPTGKPAPDALSKHKVVFASSDDGLSFVESPTPLATGCDMPDIVELRRDLPTPGEGGAKGILCVYMVDGRAGNAPGSEKIDRVWSTDGGKTWSMVQRVTVHWSNKPPGSILEPCIAQKDDGSLRMFFVVRLPPPPKTGDDNPLVERPGSPPPIRSLPGRRRPDASKPDTGTRIYSALSDDGVSFTVEDHYRYAAEGIGHPEVIHTKDAWLMFVSYNEEVHLATSPDGLNFEAVEHFNLDRGNCPGAASLPDGRIRVFQTVPNGITSVVYDPASGKIQADDGKRLQGPCANPSACAKAAGGFGLVVSRPLDPGH